MSGLMAGLRAGLAKCRAWADRGGRRRSDRMLEAGHQAVTIDPKLYKKYTGKNPGEAMTKLGQSLAEQSTRGPAGDTSSLGALARGRKYMMIGVGILVIAVVVYLLASGR